MRNLMGEAAMPRSTRPRVILREGSILAETLRALSLAGMASRFLRPRTVCERGVSRLLQVHCDVRISRQESGPNFKDFLNDMGSAASRANRLATSLKIPLDDEN